MAFPPCRGLGERIALVERFHIAPLAHALLMPGQVLHGCCDRIEHEYFTFSYEARADTRERGVFHVGHRCAASFLALTGTRAPPVFNALRAGRGEGARALPRAVRAGAALDSWCALNREAYSAIHLLTCAWGELPGTPLRAMLDWMARAPRTPLPDNEIIHLNLIVGKDRRGRTLAAMIQALRAAHPRLREFAFPEMRAVLARAGKHDYLQL